MREGRTARQRFLSKCSPKVAPALRRGTLTIQQGTGLRQLEAVSNGNRREVYEEVRERGNACSTLGFGKHALEEYAPSRAAASTMSVGRKI